MKILRRSGNESQPGARDGNPGGNKNPSDGDADSGSDGEKSKAPISREEREARYEAARLRILGSAKPSEDSAVPSKEKDESRSSSAAGKKKGKNKRTNSEDGFEARSSFNTYSTSGVATTNGVAHAGSARQMYPPYINQAGYGQMSPNPQDGSFGGAYAQMATPNPGNYPWPQPSGATFQEYSTPGWGQTQQYADDLSASFQQSMSFYEHNPAQAFSPNSNPMVMMRGGNPQNMQDSQGWSQNYSAASPPWPQSYPSQNQTSAFHDSAQNPYGMIYGGQNQMAGRRSANPNHPMPGSFNRQSFNPQSQAFIPGHPSSPSMRAFLPQLMPPSGNLGPTTGYGSPYSMQRQTSAPSQASGYASPRHPTSEQSSLRSVHGLTHPLPQPVFSPSVPMPYTMSQQQQHPSLSRQNSSSQQGDNKSSSIAKWGAGASLPPKPPPPVASQDGCVVHTVRAQPTFNSAAAARLPGNNVNGMPFHPLPSMANFRPPTGGGGN